MKTVTIGPTSGARSDLRNRHVWQWTVGIAFAVGFAGCNGLTPANTGSGQTTDPAPMYMAGGVGSLLATGSTPPVGTYQNLEAYVIDHTANTFVVNTYGPGGGLVQYSGTIGRGQYLGKPLANGILDLQITNFPGVQISSPPSTGNWAVEIPGQVALTELEATSSGATTTAFAPLVPTSSCPSLSTSTDFQFVTIPKALSTRSSVSASGWNPQIETAYGSVTIATTGTTVQFSKITQHTFTTAGATPGSPVNPASTSATAACSSSFFGQTISYPNSGTVLNPGGSQSIPPAATIGIGPTGFLLEDSGAPQGAFDTSIPPYENLLGAGYGAIGLMKPASALTTSDLASAQYQGVLYGAASGASADIQSPGFRWIASFGYSDLQTSCPTLPGPGASTVLYGGEFADNDPTANAFGNCDLAIDLGSQDSNNNGFYPAATVYVSNSFPSNGNGSAYSFPALAVAGKINGKYAIFLLGVDTAGSPAQPWGIYLLQSN